MFLNGKMGPQVAFANKLLAALSYFINKVLLLSKKRRAPLGDSSRNQKTQSSLAALKPVSQPCPNVNTRLEKLVPTVDPLDGHNHQLGAAQSRCWAYTNCKL